MSAFKEHYKIEVPMIDRTINVFNLISELQVEVQSLAFHDASSL